MARALRNEDFRKLLAERPSAAAAPTPARADGPSFTHKMKPSSVARKNRGGHKKFRQKKEAEKDAEQAEEDDGDANLREILKNYRDRAAERRNQADDLEDERAQAGYRAVPSDPRHAAELAEKRRRDIQESKYLGGDIEHTHLVKGLDYSLLNKVRNEIAAKEAMLEGNDEELEKLYADQSEVPAAQFKKPQESDNKMVRALYKILFTEEPARKSDLFASGRMAYIVDTDKNSPNELPTTLLRSIAERPTPINASPGSVSAVLIENLTRILSYMRTADIKKKKRATDAAGPSGGGGGLTEPLDKDVSIFEDAGTYEPSRDSHHAKSDKRDRKDDARRRDDKDHRDRDRDRRDRDRDRRDDRRSDRDKDRKDRDRQRDKEREKEQAKYQQLTASTGFRIRERDAERQIEERRKLEERLEQRRLEVEAEGMNCEYVECYPGGMIEMVGEDSDDEADFTQMDSKSKGLIKRWDFDHDEDYEKYQGSREAHPKAAYQFGLKPSDGRKTRKSNPNEKTVERKLDRELNEINKLIEKRKTDADGGSEWKRPRY